MLYQDDFVIILTIFFAIMMCAFSVIAYAMGKIQRRLRLLDAEFKGIKFKLRLWDALIYGDDGDDLVTGEKPTPPVRRGNVVYLTPPDDE